MTSWLNKTSLSKYFLSLAFFVLNMHRYDRPQPAVLSHRAAPLLPFLSRDPHGLKGKHRSSCYLLLPHHRERYSILSAQFPFQLHCLTRMHWLLARFPVNAAISTEPALFECFRHLLFTVRPWDIPSVQTLTSTHHL